MAETQPTPAHDSEAEYRAIEQTLLGTARGRWFLAEHGRRARRLDMTLLEDAIGRLSSSLTQPRRCSRPCASNWKNCPPSSRKQKAQ